MYIKFNYLVKNADCDLTLKRITNNKRCSIETTINPGL